MNKDNLEVVKKFMNTRFGRYFEDHKGYIEYRLIDAKDTINPITGKKFKIIKNLYFDSILSATSSETFETLNNFNMNNYHIHVGINPRIRKSGKEEDIRYVVSICVDIDEKSHNNDKAKCLKNILDFEIKPSMIIDSGHGYHGYWFINIIEVIDINKIKGIIKGVCKCMGGDAIFDLSRVLRVPGFINCKEGLEPVLVKMLPEYFFPDRIYNLSDFEEYYIETKSIKKIKSHNTIVQEIIPERFYSLLENDEFFSQTWSGKRLMPNDNSRSGFDMSIAVQLVNNGFSDEEILSILHECPSGKGKEATSEYLQYTINKARILQSEDPLKSIEEMLQLIPSDTAKIRHVEILSPIFQKLIFIEKTTAENFILYNIKEYFKITKEDARKYITLLNKLRVESKKKSNEGGKEVDIPLIIDRDIDFPEVYDAISEIGIISIDILKIVIAVVISTKLRPNPPLWLFIIGVPSSFKTELVGLLDLVKEAYTLDTLTENAFASGYVPPDGSETQDLLPLLDNKCFIVKDLNTLFSMNEEMVKKILGDLTSIFDGKFEKFTATRGLISYQSLFSMIGCITPSMMIKHYNYATQLGPRFLFLRIPELTDEEMKKSFEKSWNNENRRENINKARILMSSYCTQLINEIGKNKSDIESKEIQNKINDISSFICNARGIAISNKTKFKNEKDEDVEYYEITDWQVEQPWRILNQIKSLLRVLSFVNGTSVVGEEEIRIIKPIILSTMPVDRAEILKVLTTRCGISAKELSKEIRKSTKTIQRTLKELSALKLTDCYRDPAMNATGKAPWLFFIVPKYASILNAPLPSRESMSQSKQSIGEPHKNDDENW